MSTTAIGTRIRDLRKARGLTQADLAAAAGIPQSHVSKIEAGKVDIKASTLAALAAALDASLLEPI